MNPQAEKVINEAKGRDRPIIKVKKMRFSLKTGTRITFTRKTLRKDYLIVLTMLIVRKWKTFQ